MRGVMTLLKRILSLLWPTSTKKPDVKVGGEIEHTTDAVCPLCELKLSKVHPFLTAWFHGVKARYPDLHISWGFRDEASQTAAVASGSSKDLWPTSLHNKTPSHAIDVFQINGAGKGVWNNEFMRLLDTENQKNRIAVLWGGNYKGSFKDMDHFYLPNL